MTDRDWQPLARGPWDSPGLDVQGHRGARGRMVENVVDGFLLAASLGCRSVELDVLLTADGVPVVWHDPVLLADKMTGSDDLVGRRVDELDLEELQSIDVGSRTLARFPDQEAVPGARISTLEDLLLTVGGAYPRLWFTVEVKVDARDERMAARREELVRATILAIRRAGVGEHAIIHSFDWAVLDLARRLDPDLTRSALLVPGVTCVPGSPWTGPVDPTAHGEDVVSAAREAGAHMLAPHFAVTEDPTPDTELYVTRELVQAAHDQGLAVVSWTVNHPEDLRAVVAAGVDGVVTDHPDRALGLDLTVG
ncbi:glycerophosphodiester phosphodiesterase family protein [Arsenicicoccus dermatophilus]|uniref:glycerophosphodiester phosphodiesterase family protein n=1 Tax=Arsenicicoccus dermatophilus TaxID=1076331 RepID=UPI003916E7E2